MIGKTIPFLLDPSNLKNDYYDYGLRLFKEIEHNVDWNDFKIMYHQGKYFYIVEKGGFVVTMVYDPALNLFSIVESGSKYAKATGGVTSSTEFDPNSFIVKVNQIFAKEEESYKPGQSRTQKRQKESKKKIKDTKEFANTTTPSTGVGLGLQAPPSGSDAVLGGAQAVKKKKEPKPRVMAFGPYEAPKTYNGSELGGSLKEYEIEQKTVIRDGKPVVKDLPPDDKHKIVYEDDKPKIKPLTQTEISRKENGAAAGGQQKRDAQMVASQAKRIESLKKTI